MNKTNNKFIADDCISSYFKDVRKIPVISLNDEQDLYERIKYKDQEAINALIKANLKFVVTIAKEYQGNGIELGDLINEGNYGLIKAANRFDPQKGIKFISYAVWWIRQSIMQCLNENSRLVRLPVNIIQDLAGAKKEIEIFENSNQRQAFPGELSDSLSHKNILIEQQRHIRFNHENDEEDLFIEHDEENESIDKNLILKKELEKILNCLDDRSREIVELYFGLNDSDVLTLEQIGLKFNLTKERVRQIKEKAIRRLKNESESIFKLLKS